MRVDVLVGYILTKLEPYLDQSVPDSVMDAIFEDFRREIPKILDMDDYDLEIMAAALMAGL